MSRQVTVLQGGIKSQVVNNYGRDSQSSLVQATATDWVSIIWEAEKTRKEIKTIYQEEVGQYKELATDAFETIKANIKDENAISQNGKMLVKYIPKVIEKLFQISIAQHPAWKLYSKQIEIFCDICQGIENLKKQNAIFNEMAKIITIIEKEYDYGVYDKYKVFEKNINEKHKEMGDYYTATLYYKLAISDLIFFLKKSNETQDKRTIYYKQSKKLTEDIFKYRLIYLKECESIKKDVEDMLKELNHALLLALSSEIILEKLEKYYKNLGKKGIFQKSILPYKNMLDSIERDETDYNPEDIMDRCEKSIRHIRDTEEKITRLLLNTEEKFTRNIDGVIKSINTNWR